LSTKSNYQFLKNESKSKEIQGNIGTGKNLVVKKIPELGITDQNH